jgi:hypothetical protein
MSVDHSFQTPADASSTSAPAAVTIIVPTRALCERSKSLPAAIESILSQEGVHAVPLVVFDHTTGSAEVESALRLDRRIRLLQVAPVDVPAKLRAGRAQVTTPFFGTLDDDDLLAPGGLARRLDVLRQHPDCTVVVSNGYLRRTTGDTVFMPPDANVAANPLRAMVRANWCLPGSWLARTDKVGADLFDGMPPHLENTFLALRFATEYHMRWLDEPTVTHVMGSPAAQSMSREFVLGQADALRRIIRLALPREIRAEYRRRIAAAYHAAADHDYHAGYLADAWRWHLASLRSPGGWRYLPFTRHLVRAALVTGRTLAGARAEERPTNE